MQRTLDADDEVIFITYEDVIKSFIPYVLQELQKPEYKIGYCDAIDYTKFEGYNHDRLMGVVNRRTCKNVLEYLSIQNFDYDITYDELVNRYPDIALRSTLLTIGESIVILLQQKFTKKIYVYSQQYDSRIELDLLNTYRNDPRIVYVHGDFSDCVKNISEKITSYIINDIDYINELISLNRVQYTNILLANYGYNYKLDTTLDLPILKIDDIDKVAEDNIFKLRVFSIYDKVIF